MARPQRQRPVPGAKSNRRMSIVRLADGGLVFYHAIPLAEEALAEVLAWGTPRALVIGHQQHGIDAAAFAEKLKIGIYGPAPIEAKLRARWPQLAGTTAAIPGDDRCTFEELEGTRSGEPVQIVKSAGGTSLVWCDAFCATPARLRGWAPHHLALPRALHEGQGRAQGALRAARGDPRPDAPRALPRPHHQGRRRRRAATGGFHSRVRCGCTAQWQVARGEETAGDLVPSARRRRSDGFDA